MSSQLGWARVRDDSARSSPCRARRTRSFLCFRNASSRSNLISPGPCVTACFSSANKLRLAHELTHLQISIQEGSGTRDPHEDRDQWKFQENNRHTQRYKYVNRARASEKAWGEKGFEPRTPWREKGTTQQVSQG